MTMIDVGMTVRKPVWYNLRVGPGARYDTAAVNPACDTVIIRGGPVDADGCRWWNVEVPGEKSAWCAETIGGEAMLHPVAARDDIVRDDRAASDHEPHASNAAQ